MALEDDAVETGEHRDDQAGKLGDEARQRLHGVLLRKGGSANPILKVERRFCSSYLVAALPRWGSQKNFVELRKGSGSSPLLGVAENGAIVELTDAQDDVEHGWGGERVAEGNDLADGVGARDQVVERVAPLHIG